MKSKFRSMAFCCAVAFIGCSQSPQESVVLEPKGADMIANDLVFNVEGLT